MMAAKGAGDEFHGVPADRLPSEDWEVDSDGEALVLVSYAAAMDAIQALEFSLKHLAATADKMPDDISPDDAWKRTLTQLTSPMGRLKANAPEELAERLGILRPIRNSLAHDVLLWWRINTNLGLTSHQEVADSLVNIEDNVRRLDEEISALADQNMADLGLEPGQVEIPAGEMRKMLLGMEDD